MVQRGTAGPCSGGEMGVEGLCVFVCGCVLACVLCVCLCCACVDHSFFLSRSTHTRRAVPIDFVSVSLYCNFISVVLADGGPEEEGVFVY